MRLALAVSFGKGGLDGGRGWGGGPGRKNSHQESGWVGGRRRTTQQSGRVEDRPTDECFRLATITRRSFFWLPPSLGGASCCHHHYETPCRCHRWEPLVGRNQGLWERVLRGNLIMLSR